MPRDGTFVEPKISTEEQTLRDVDSYYSEPQRWIQSRGGSIEEGGMCVGRAVIVFWARRSSEMTPRPEKLLGLSNPASYWNDSPGRTFAEVKSLLKQAIARYA